MKYVTIFVFWSVFITYVSAQACIPDSDKFQFGTSFINDVIDDNATGEIATFPVQDIENAIISGTLYMDTSVNVEDGTVTVYVTDEFANFEENTATVQDVTVLLQFQIQLICTSSSFNLRFFQEINDINNHAPVFSEMEYRYSLPMPLPSQIEITQFGPQIIATDIDITNIVMNFEVVDSDLFSITYGGTLDTLAKSHTMTMVALRPLEISETTTFTLRATDVGYPELSTTAILTIEVDEENSLGAAPIFSSVYYVIDYIISSDSLHTAEVTISVSDADSAVFEIEGEYRNNFELTYETGLLNIRLISNLEENDLEQGGFRPIILIASISAFRYTKATLILRLPEQTISVAECSVGFPESVNMIGNVFVNPTIRDDASGVVAVLTIPKIISVIGIGNDYLEASVISDNQVQISLTDQFQNYEAGSTESNLRLHIAMTCMNTIDVLIFVQPIINTGIDSGTNTGIDVGTNTGIGTTTDVRKGILEFDRDEYVYRLPMPFPCGLDVTRYGPEIIATDSLSSDIIFDIDSDYFSFSYKNLDNAGNNTYRGFLTALKRLYFGRRQTFTLTATDPKFPNQNSTTKIIIESETTKKQSYRKGDERKSKLRHYL